MAVKPEFRQQVEADITARQGVTVQDMMGTTAYMVRNRMFAFWVADGLVARLPDNVRRDFFDRQEGVEFQGPQGRGQRDWTRLALGKKKDVETVLSAVKSAYEFARGTETARSKTRKKARR